MSNRSNFQNEDNSHLRLLYLYRLLERCTDEDHRLTTNEIRDIMKKDHGIYMHRTTVYYDIELLKTAGIDVQCYRGRANQYYLVNRSFEIPEIRLLIDAVESSRFMTESQSAALIEKLMKLTSNTGADKLKRNLHVTGRVKSGNRQVFYIVDAINDAINAGRKISFRYFDYNARKQPKMRNKGKPYTVSPYSLIWNGDYYYLVGYHHEKEDIRTYRVDRIKEQPIILNESADAAPKDFDITRYTREVFRMYDTEETIPVTLVCENEVMKGVLDAFGMEIKVKKVDSEHFQTTVEVCASPTFFAWVFQWQGKVKILGPEKVLAKYRKMAQAEIA